MGESAVPSASGRPSRSTPRRNDEAKLKHEILLDVGARPNVRVWSNQTGQAWTRSGHPIKYGLVGSADIIGILKPSGRFLAIEVKSPIGVQEPEQIAFETMVRAMGGVYILARTLADVTSWLDVHGYTR